MARALVLPVTIWPGSCGKRSRPRGDVLDLFSGYTPGAAPDKAPATDPRQLSAHVIQSALDRHSGNQELAWRELGLTSRFVLKPHISGVSYATSGITVALNGPVLMGSIA